MNVKWCVPLLAEPREEPRVKCNASIPTLAISYAARLAATTNEPPELMTESDNAQQLSNDANKSLDLHRSDNDLGDLDWRFSANNGWMVMDEEVCHLNSQLVIVDQDNEGVEHMLHGSRSELYLANNLRSLDHSFKNVIEIPNIQTNPLRSIHYPQGRDNFTEDLSVV